MTFKNMFIATGLAVALTTGVATTASAHGMGGGTAPCGGYQSGQMGPGYGMGPGMMGQGMMNGGMGYGMGQGYGMNPMMGRGMMGGQGMGPGMMGQGMMGGQTMMDRNIQTEDVRRMMEYQLYWNGNPNLKLGKIKEVSDDVMSAEVVTKDGSLVQRYLINRHTGWMQPAPQQ